jgi:hypothetical protein
MQRLLRRVRPYGDAAMLCAGIFVLITIATFAADALDRTVLEACQETGRGATGAS